MKNKTRYFIVFYTANSTSTLGIINGHMDIICTGEVAFLNLEETIKIIKEQNKKFKDVCLTNFVEVKKTDYDIWKKYKKVEDE